MGSQNGDIQSFTNAKAVGTHINSHTPQTRPAPAQQPHGAHHRYLDAFTHSPTARGRQTGPQAAVRPLQPRSREICPLPLTPFPAHSPRRCAAPRPGQSGKLCAQSSGNHRRSEEGRRAGNESGWNTNSSPLRPRSISTRSWKSAGRLSVFFFFF